MKESCKTCRFSQVPLGADQGWLCRKGPPGLNWVVLPPQQNAFGQRVDFVPQPCGGFPSTQADWWCGAWEPDKRILDS